MWGPAFLKWFSLCLMMMQNTLTPLIFRYATTGASSSERFSTPVSLLLMELLKLVLSCLFIAVEEGFSPIRAAAVIDAEVLRKPRDTLALAVPAILYAVQNAALQWAGAHLPAAIFQVTYQGKTLVMAAFSVLLLQKQLLRAQWLAILIMGAGIAVVQISDAKETKQASMANAEEQSETLGLFFILVACMCSGFASVYFEKIVKHGASAKSPHGAAPAKKASLWVQNAQLAGFTVLINSCGVISERLASRNGVAGLSGNGSKPALPRGLLHGFTPGVWMMIVNNAFGGMIVALVIKHADNILRGFATALSTILATLGSVILFGFVLRPAFGVGTVMVIGSVLLYGSILKIPGGWWNSESQMCARLRNVNSERAFKDGEVELKTNPCTPGK